MPKLCLQSVFCRRDRASVSTDFTQIPNTNHQMYMVHHIKGSLILGEKLFAFVIPGILHFCGFIVAIYVFRVKDNEHLQNLVERVKFILFFF